MTVLAVDGGGSSVRLAMADREGDLVRFVSRDGGMNPLDNPDWLGNLRRALDAVEAELGAVDFAVLGVPATGEVPDNDRRVAAEIAGFLPVPHAIRNDVALAHYGAFAGGPGILVLSGTGSMAMAGPGGDAALERTGGWGEEIGDEGSALWIGREALSLAARTVDGRADAVPLRDALFRHLGLDASDGLAALLGWYYGQPHRRSATAALARVIDALAAGGDAHAGAIVDRAGELLSEHADALRRRLPGAAAWPWSHAGGAFASERLRARVAELQGSRPQPPSLPPIGGGLLEAARRGGLAPYAGWIARLRGALAAANKEKT
ncbi:N-acetylglucosamine kinase [Aureimonas leprariae]|uniref:N-acetylglucosamine kinase n=1 Tax=Plantimonas leprariae TaxID=2615207 RepID=UPI0013875D73|nr:BadF/BadG/BcrA/BcrD ATPase family protein [Aureimonas leprariae]